MLELTIRPKAEADLKQIWRYSHEQWGTTQADRYLREVEREIQELVQCPNLGVSYEHIRARYRGLHVKRHLVFYRHQSQWLEIVRVLLGGT